MNKNFVAKAVLAGLGCFTADAGAANLNPNGLGQALIYPYYTVNANQQTLLSVVNTADVGKLVKVRFLEAYNGRDVLAFNLYLSPHDVWTANIFALADAALTSDRAGIFTTDTSCTDPLLNGSGNLNLGGHAQPYQQFLTQGYTATNADSGPATDARTREGHVEIVLMSNIQVASQLGADIAHTQPGGIPANCADNLQTAPGRVAPTGANGFADGGLFGSISILDATQGTFYTYNADAIDGFSYEDLFTIPGDAQPTLASVNDRGSATTATAHVLAKGEMITAVFPSTTAGSRRIDAVSALFAADNVYNEYVAASDGASGTDWVLTFPTKRFYVDAQPFGAAAGAGSVFAPFEEQFGQSAPGQACITIASDSGAYNREEGFSGVPSCGGLTTCPPLPAPARICLETNVIRFGPTSILGSQLPTNSYSSEFSEGMLRLGVSGTPHDMYPATNGNIFHGLPVAGFAATQFINSFVARPQGGFALANYTGSYHHRVTTNCTKGTDPCS